MIHSQSDIIPKESRMTYDDLLQAHELTNIIPIIFYEQPLCQSLFQFIERIARISLLTYFSFFKHHLFYEYFR